MIDGSKPLGTAVSPAGFDRSDRQERGVPKPTKAHPVAAGKSSYGALLGPPPASIGSQKWNEFRLGALEQWGSSAAHGDPSDDGLSVPHSEAFFLKVSNIDHRRCLT